jgi:hypothetical protein
MFDPLPILLAIFPYVPRFHLPIQCAPNLFISYPACLAVPESDMFRFARRFDQGYRASVPMMMNFGLIRCLEGALAIMRVKH